MKLNTCVKIYTDILNFNFCTFHLSSAVHNVNLIHIKLLYKEKNHDAVYSNGMAKTCGALPGKKNASVCIFRQEL